MQKRLHLLIAMVVFFATAAMAQITTSGISGKVTSNGEEVIGATITATHQPSGTVYRAVTNENGRYTIQGMRPGGPYKVEVSYIGYEPKTFDKVQLNLGESQNLSCSLQENARELQEVVVQGKAGLNGTKTGAAQSINAQQIAEMPSISHSIADVARLNPQLSTNGQSGSMTFAGTNNRYNSFQIDGAINNDSFGLTSNGSNGGQAETQPVSMETIDQIQVSVAPFDVRQGGFTGGSINAITKSGTNDFHGSAYFYGNNQDLVGRHYKLTSGQYSQPYDNEKETMFGFTLGGPIVKNKLFFFANYERSVKSYPNQYGYGSEGAKYDSEEADKILNAVFDLAQRQGYDYSTSWATAEKENKSDKAGLKLDWNINDFNKFSVRYSYVGATSTKGIGGMSSLNTADHLYEFHSKTHSVAAELQSRISPTLSNEARLTYVRVRDNRTSGAAAPSITINNVGDGGVNIGNEYSSMANRLDQDIYTIEDNFTWYKGAHTFTFGTHNEIYTFNNLFIQNKYGAYSFKKAADFFDYYNSVLAGQPNGKFIDSYYSYCANVDVTGTDNWSPKFSAGQLGFYVQDKWDATNNFQLTYGLRMEIPLFFDTPTENAGFNDWAAQNGLDFKTNRKLSSSPMWSPRVGFRWDINSDRKYILRGGVGVFTGRIPFVWLSNSFQNTGLQFTKFQSRNGSAKDLQLIMDPNKQYINTENLKAQNTQEVNVFDKNFKFAQNLRFNLGFDFQALGIEWTAEGIFSKTLNDVYYQNLAYTASGKTFGDVTGLTFDNRPMYQSIVSDVPYKNIYAIRNSSKGYTYSLSLQATKRFAFGLDLSASYTFVKSKSVNSATSSVASSNFNNNFTYRFSNDPELSNSGYNIPHTVKASAFYHLDWGPGKLFKTTVGLIYQGQSGSPYTFKYSGDVNGDGSNGNDAIFIPTDEQIDQMKFTAYSKSGVSYTVEQQRANLKQWLASTDYVKDHRGEYFKRYAANLPFESHFDFHFAQKFGIKAGKYVHALEVSFDVMNVANLLNKKWGRTYSSSYNSEFVAPIIYNTGDHSFNFAHDGDWSAFDPSDYYSRWRGQLGVKYTF